MSCGIVTSIVTAVLFVPFILSCVAINHANRVASNSVEMHCNLGATDVVKFSKRMDCLEMTTMASCSPPGDNSTTSRVEIVFPGLRTFSVSSGHLACATSNAEMHASAPPQDGMFSAHVWPEKGRGYTVEYTALGWILGLIGTIGAELALLRLYFKDRKYQQEQKLRRRLGEIRERRKQETARAGFSDISAERPPPFEMNGRCAARSPNDPSS